MLMDDLQRIAKLLRERNAIDDQIAEITKRPMVAGHLGEWIAAQVFDIELELSAVATAIDGRFRSGPLAGRTVNIKWYLKREGLLDMTMSDLLDEYLVMTGPVSAAMSSRGQTRPWRIDAVYLFDARALRADLLERGRRVGVASSVRAERWKEAEIYPQDNPRLPLSAPAREALRMFAPSGPSGHKPASDPPIAPSRRA
jgi:hypothetical protein